MATREVPEVNHAPAAPFNAAVFGATVQLPALDKIEPEAWFAVADANFALRKVTDSTTRYYYVLSKLDSTTLRKLSAFLKRLRGSDPYAEVRKQLCKALEPSKEQKLDALLATSSMGDERPMEFGLELLWLLGESTTDDILKRIFLRSALPAIVIALKGSRHVKFEELLEAAEDAWATEAATAGAPAATVAAVSTPNTVQRHGGRGGRQRGSRSSAPPRMIQLCYFIISSETRQKDAVRLVSNGTSTIAQAIPAPKFSR